MIRALKLKNFRKHRELHLTFTEGLNVIRGPNWAGKSSLMMAIVYALFGTRAVPGGKKVLCTHGENDCEVELHFSVGTDDFIITRTVNNARMMKNGDDVATGHTPVSEYVENLFNMNLKRFDQLSYSKQSETAALVTLGATELQKSVEDMSGLDLIDRVIKAAGKDVQKLQGQLEGQHTVDLEPLEAAMGDANDAHEKAYADLGNANDRLAGVRDARDTADKALSDAHAQNRQRDTIRDLEAKVDAAAGECSRLHDELEACPAVDTAAAKAAVDTAKATLNDRRKVVERRAEVESETARVEEWLPGARENAALEAEIDAELPKLDARIAELTGPAQEARDERVRAQEELRRAKAAAKSGICGECRRPLEDHDPDAAKKAVADAEAKVEQASLAEAEAAKALQDARDERDQLAAKHPGAGWADLIEQNEKYLDSLAGEWAVLKDVDPAELETLQQAVDTAQQAYTEAYSKAQAHEAARKRYDDACDRHNTLQVQLDGMGEMPPEVDTTPLQAAADKAKADYDAAVAECQRLAQIEAEANRAYVDAKRAFDTAKATNERAAALESELALLTGFVKHLRDNRIVFLQQVWDTVMGIVTDFARSVSEGAIEQVRFEDGNFYFTEDGTEAPIEAASGGQKAIIGVGLRLAMEACFYGGKAALFLDEPSAELNNHFASLLAGALGANERQVVMITHRDAEEFSATNVITLGEAA